MGMAAIPATALIHEITILRPILTAQRGIIEAYLREIGWPCVWDPSNHNHKYERVKIRHMLKAFQEAFAEIDVSNRLAAAASNADRANSFIHDYTDKMWHQHLKLQTDDCIMLDNQIYQLHDEILLRILSKTIRKFGITAPKMPALLNMLYILKNSPSVIHTTKGCVIKKRESDSIFTATAKAF
jgi:tRNA(Ile)-lysidine synthase